MTHTNAPSLPAASTVDDPAYLEGRPAGTALHLPATRLPASAYRVPASHWLAAHHNKLTSAAAALTLIHTLKRVYIGGGCGAPSVLTQELVRQADRLRDVEILQVLTAGPAPYAAPDLAASFPVNALFIGGNVRLAVQAGPTSRRSAYPTSRSCSARGNCRLMSR